jgi:mono/diheme cytochrome c family protein
MIPSRPFKQFAAATLAALLWLVAGGALAQNSAPGLARGSVEPAVSAGFRFSEQSGEALYANVCQACHMPDGKGATGAGTYPALAGDKNLAAAGYPIHILIHGQRGMPPIGLMMTDAQVAAVVNYVRTHFGNAYQDAVTPEEIKSARP